MSLTTADLDEMRNIVEAAPFRDRADRIFFITGVTNFAGQDSAKRRLKFFGDFQSYDYPSTR